MVNIVSPDELLLTQCCIFELQAYNLDKKLKKNF